MTRKNSIHPKYLYLVSTFIFGLGLGGAALVYMNAEDDGDDATGYGLINGVVYPIAPRDAKRYQHDLALYGGKVAVLADEFSTWFGGLWHGKTLAVTVAIISVALSGGLILVASRLRSDPSSHIEVQTPDDG